MDSMAQKLQTGSGEQELGDMEEKLEEGVAITHISPRRIVVDIAPIPNTVKELKEASEIERYWIVMMLLGVAVENALSEEVIGLGEESDKLIKFVRKQITKAAKSEGKKDGSG